MPEELISMLEKNLDQKSMLMLLDFVQSLRKKIQEKELQLQESVSIISQCESEMKQLELKFNKLANASATLKKIREEQTQLDSQQQNLIRLQERISNRISTAEWIEKSNEKKEKELERREYNLYVREEELDEAEENFAARREKYEEEVKKEARDEAKRLTAANKRRFESRAEEAEMECEEWVRIYGIKYVAAFVCCFTLMIIWSVYSKTFWKDIFIAAKNLWNVISRIWGLTGKLLSLFQIPIKWLDILIKVIVKVSVTGGAAAAAGYGCAKSIKVYRKKYWDDIGLLVLMGSSIIIPLSDKIPINCVLAFLLVQTLYMIIRYTVMRIKRYRKYGF